MGNASGAVKFPDGTIMYCEYWGSVDTMWPWLYETKEELDENWRRQDDPPKFIPDGSDEPVEIMSMYGRSFWWHGRASKSQRLITAGRRPHQYHETPGAGWSAALTDSYTPPNGGVPDWSPWRDRKDR